MSEQGPEQPSPPAEGATEPPKRVNPRQPEPVGPETIERFGRPMRIFPVAVSTDVMAQAWANKESAPHGAAVIVEHEINPRGLHGALWQTPPTDTLAVAVVLRPSVSPEEGDITWLVGALAGLDAIEAMSKTAFAAWWPDAIVETETSDPVAGTKSEVQLGPGQIKNAVVTVRFDLLRLDLDPEKDRDPLCEAFVHAIDRVSEDLAEHGSSRVATAYGERCTMLGKRVKVRLRPKGETRGIARRVDRAARLEVESLSGMVERIGVNQLMELEVVERPASAGSPG
jgi:BirA family biotin operon repressor/biotin-[acetyl-CoA-carboxylase] ligase